MKKIGKMTFIFMLGALVALTINVTAETLMDSGAVSYSNSNTNETTVSGALDELFSAIEINKQIGDMTKISNVGDGTIAGAISNINNTVSELNSNLTDINTKIDELSHSKLTPFSITVTTDVHGDVYLPTHTGFYGNYVSVQSTNGYYYAVSNSSGWFKLWACGGSYAANTTVTVSGYYYTTE